MDQPKIPTLKDSQKPQVKVRGLGAGLSFFDRMKQFNKKDLAFILAGLGTLFMAPLAEHFMMSPDNGDASLSPGFGSGKGAGPGIFGAEDRTSDGSGTAVGSPVGGSDVITPLNVRDPSSLIMGPGSSSQPPTNSSASVAPPVSAPGRSDQDVRDALAGAASHAASAAVKKSLLPVPKIGLSGSSLRGLGVATGNSSATAGGGPSTQGLGLGSHGNVGSNMAGVKGGDKIASVGPRGLTTGVDALTALKAAGDKAGGMFDRAAGSAQGNLNAAANEAIPGGGGQSEGGGSGPGGGGPGDKPGNGGGPKDSKSGGESLAYELMKQNLQKQLELYWKEQEAMDPTLELYKLRNTFAESLAGAIAGPIGGALGSYMGCNLLGPAGGYMPFCLQGNGGPYTCNGINGANAQTIPQNMVSFCQAAPAITGAGGAAVAAGAGFQYPYAVASGAPSNLGTVICACQTVGAMPVYPCSGMGGGGVIGTGCNIPSGANTKPGTPATPPGVGQIDGGISVAVQGQAKGLGEIGAQCDSLTKVQNTPMDAGTTSGQYPDVTKWMPGALAALKSLATARMELTGQADPSCGVQIGDNVPALRITVLGDINNAMNTITSGGKNGALNATTKDGSGVLGGAGASITSAEKTFSLANSKINTDVPTLLKAGTVAPAPTDCPTATCGPITSAASDGATAIQALIQPLTTAQAQLGQLLDQAGEAVGGAPATTQGNQGAATGPTVAQVQGTNTVVDALNTAIGKAGGGLTAPNPAPGPAQGPTTVTPAGQIPADQTATVEQSITNANKAVATACGAINYKPDCSAPLTSTDPKPAPLPAGQTAQTAINAITDPINKERGAAWTQVTTISAAATALQGTPAAPAAPH